MEQIERVISLLLVIKKSAMQINDRKQTHAPLHDSDNRTNENFQTINKRRESIRTIEENQEPVQKKQFPTSLKGYQQKNRGKSRTCAKEAISHNSQRKWKRK